MPGTFGGVGCSDALYHELRKVYEESWDGCDFQKLGNAALGGHTFQAAPAVRRIGGTLYAVDGEPSAYQHLSRLDPQSDQYDLLDNSGHLRVPRDLTGNVVRLTEEGRLLEIGADWAGAFPLYYAHRDGSLLFSNLLRPLAKAVHAAPDWFGGYQFLRKGYIYDNRTPFTDIYRLRPGEVVRYSAGEDSLTRYDRSKLWVGPPVQRENLPQICLEHLRDSLETSLGPVESAALMMSGGWDTRTLLAGLNELKAGSLSTKKFEGFSHGDPGSRELTLAAKLCEKVGLHHRTRRIDTRDFCPDTMSRNFKKTGTALFPQWHISGHALASAGVDCAIVGIFSGALGGGNVNTTGRRALRQAFQGSDKVFGPGRGEGESPESPVEVAMSVLGYSEDSVEGSWYLSDGVTNDITDMGKRLNAEMRSYLERFRKRGIRTADRLLEAFKEEHRAAQYIAAQTVNARVAVDVSVPLANRDFMAFASRIPIGEKLNNSLNRQMLQAASSNLAKFPMAATLVPADAAIPFQEVSRAARKLYEIVRWKTYFSTGGTVSPPRLSWVNFEFLRGNEVLHQVVDELELTVWERRAMRKRIDELASMKRKERMHPYFDQLAKIFTIDLLYR